MIKFLKITYAIISGLVITWGVGRARGYVWTGAKMGRKEIIETAFLIGYTIFFFIILTMTNFMDGIM